MSNYYYSGQGSVSVAERDPLTGKPKGFVRIGNVPEITIDIEVTKFDHKESESGNRLLDLSIIQEKKGKFKMKVENISLENLALGLYGESSAVVGATVTAEEVTAYLGKRCPLMYPGVSTVVVNAPASSIFIVSHAYALNALVHPITPNGHYYKVTTAGTTAGTEPTYPTNGTTVTSGTAVLTDMGTNVKVLNTDYTLDAVNGVIVPLSTGTILEGDVVTVDYVYDSYGNLEAFTSAASPERWIRFEGINTVDDSHVIVDMYRGQFDPLTNYMLINTEIASLDMGGSLLADSFITVGSKFYRQRNIGA